MQRRKLRLSRKAIVYFYMILILLILTVGATYTWFSLSTRPKVSDMYLYINSENGLELALLPTDEEWVHQLSLTDVIGSEAFLRPATWSQKNMKLYAMEYGFDGRSIGFFQLSDEKHANRQDSDGYYALKTFYIRSLQNVSLQLAPAMEVEQGVAGAGTFLIGSPSWDAAAGHHINGGNGTENAARVGLFITPLGTDYQPITEETIFRMYEPNCDAHADGEKRYIPTRSIDDTEQLVPDNMLIPQTVSTWTESYPIEHGVVQYDLGDFRAEPYLLRMKQGQIYQVRLYIWLEGQDVDCDDNVGQSATWLANIQFTGIPDTQSGIVDIPD